MTKIEGEYNFLTEKLSIHEVLILITIHSNIHTM